MSQRIHLHNVRVIQPRAQLDTVTDVWIHNGTLIGLGEAPSNSHDYLRKEATGLWLMPGLVDLSCGIGAHNMETEARAAQRSGFTHVCNRPDTHAPIDSTSAVAMLQEANTNSPVTLLPVGALTHQLDGEQLSNMGLLKEAGCIALSQAHTCMKSAYVMRRALEYAATYDLTVHLSPREASLWGDGCMHEGATATRLGLAGIPESAETVGLANIILLAEQTGARVHISQLSCARSVELLRQARSRGLSISADTALANVLYTDQCVQGFDALYRVDPPLRTDADRQALLNAVAQKELALTTNHQPCDSAAKLAPFAEAAIGMSMLDAALPLALTLVNNGHLSLDACLHALSTQPCDITQQTMDFALGAPVSVSLVDPNAAVCLDVSDVHSCGSNAPFIGQALQGKVLMSIHAGTHHEL